MQKTWYEFAPKRTFYGGLNPTFTEIQDLSPVRPGGGGGAHVWFV